MKVFLIYFLAMTFLINLVSCSVFTDFICNKCNICDRDISVQDLCDCVDFCLPSITKTTTTTTPIPTTIPSTTPLPTLSPSELKIKLLNEKYNCSLPITLDLFYNTIKNDTDTSLTPLSDSSNKNTITTSMLITLILTIINI